MFTQSEPQFFDREKELEVLESEEIINSLDQLIQKYQLQLA
jgi:hypothetical protein